jgi:hypothetical protein
VASMVKNAADLLVTALAGVALAGVLESRNAPVQEDENDLGYWLPSCPDCIPEWMS